MGKCIQCGNETKNKYAIKAGQLLDTMVTISGNYRTTTEKYSIKESIENYVCPKCEGKKALKIYLPLVILVTVVLTLVAIFIPQVLIIIPLPLFAISIWFLASWNTIYGIKGIIDKNDVPGATGTWKMLLNTHKKALKTRNYKCKILYDEIFIVERKDMVISRKKTFIDGTDKAITAYVIGSNFENKTAFYTLEDIAIAFNGTKKQFDIIFNDDKESISLIPGKPYKYNENDSIQGMKRSVRGITIEVNIHIRQNTTKVLGCKINERFFFNLVDIIKLLDVQCFYNEKAKAFEIDSSMGFR